MAFPTGNNKISQRREIQTWASVYSTSLVFCVSGTCDSVKREEVRRRASRKQPIDILAVSTSLIEKGAIIRNILNV